jgi:hypothetical protein
MTAFNPTEGKKTRYALTMTGTAEVDLMPPMKAGVRGSIEALMIESDGTGDTLTIRFKKADGTTFFRPLRARPLTDSETPYRLPDFPCPFREGESITAQVTTGGGHLEICLIVIEGMIGREDRK